MSLRRRIISNVLAAGSTVLFFVTAVVFVRVRSTDLVECGIRWSDHALIVLSMSPMGGSGDQYLYLQCVFGWPKDNHSTFFWYGSMAHAQEPSCWALHDPWEWDHLGFSITACQAEAAMLLDDSVHWAPDPRETREIPSSPMTNVVVGVRVAYVLVLLALWPIIWTAMYYRRKAMAHPLGAVPCPSCGYDLRMTPHCCPECGARPAHPI